MAGKLAGKVEVTWLLSGFCRWHFTKRNVFVSTTNAISASFIRRNYRVFAPFVLTKGTIEQNATESANVACACT